MQYGLFKKGVQKQLYKFAVANINNVPDKNNEQQLAGEELIRCLWSGTKIFLLWNPGLQAWVA